MFLLDLYAPAVEAMIVDSITVRLLYEHIVRWIGLLMFLIFLRIFINLFCEIILPKLKYKMSFELKVGLLEHFHKVSLLAYKKYDAVYLVDRVNKDIEYLVSFFLGNYVFILLQGLVFIAALCISCYVEKSIGLCFLFLVPFYLLVYFYFKKKLYGAGLSAKEEDNRLIQCYNEQLFQLEEVKGQGNLLNHIKYIGRTFASSFTAQRKLCTVKSKFQRLEAVLYHSTHGILLLVGSYSILQGKITLGVLVMLSQYMTIMVLAVSYYVNFSADYEEAKVTYNRLQELFSLEQEKKGTKKLKQVDTIEADIRFGYTGGEELLYACKFRGELGNCYAAVGHNGCGKSTFLKQLLGIYPVPDTSSILFNNIGVKDLDMTVVRNMLIGYVSQHHSFTNKVVAEIFEEVVPDITLENLKEKLDVLSPVRRTEAIDIVRSLWEKEAQDLSGGEHQIAAFLRVLCKKPYVLVLDEPTAALDETRKRWVEETILELKAKMLVIVVSHDANFSDMCQKVCFIPNPQN